MKKTIIQHFPSKGWKLNNSHIPKLIFSFLLLILVSTPLSATLKSNAQYQWEKGVFKVPLEIKDNSGVYRTGWPVQTGVPLPQGLIQSTKSLRLTDTTGKEIRSQFTVLSRYNALDNSIRWVLLDFQINLDPNKKRTIYLTNDRPHKKLFDIPIYESFSEIEIDTGQLQLVIAKNTGNIIQSAKILGIPIIEAKATDGAKIRSGKISKMERFTGKSWNTHGWESKRKMVDVKIAEKLYASSTHNNSPKVSIELTGPMRTVILIKGRYLPEKKSPGTLDNGIYNYTTRLHFYRGKSYIKVEHDIENSSTEQPQWNYLFREASLKHSLTLGPDLTATIAGGKSIYQLPSSKTVNLSANSEIEVYQYPPKKKKNIKNSTGFFEVIHSKNGIFEPTVSTGKFVRLFDISDQEKGLSIAMRYFWEEAPRAISFSKNTLNIHLHADTRDYIDRKKYKRPGYSLDFGARSIDDVLYYFHLGNAEEAEALEIAQAFEYPLIAHAPPAWYSDTEAWYFEVNPSLPKRTKKNEDRHAVSKNIGWYYHGKNTEFNSGGHHINLNSRWINFIRTGSLNEYERNQVISRWSISQLPGLNYRKENLKFGGQRNKYSLPNQNLLSWNQLTGFGSKDFYLWRENNLKGTETYLNEYKALPDMEHYALFNIFEYYYLTGDARALDTIRGFVAWDLNFQHKHMLERRMPSLNNTSYFEDNPEALRRGHYSRIYTWMLYTNLAGYHATGNSVYNEFAKWQIRRMLTLLRHRHGQLTSWDVEANKLFSFLPGDLEEKIANKIDYSLIRKKEKIMKSKTKTWMEAQGALALHEAYKTYNDERILDGLWAQADYFSNHVPFFPKLGMFNNVTNMPNKHFGTDKSSLLSPLIHVRHIQALPILYHYTGWNEIRKRYDIVRKTMSKNWVQARYKQTIYWEKKSQTKKTIHPPQRITDLRLIAADLKNGIRLNWTSPEDDGENGKAKRYFVKYSDKPIVQFAPTDNPQRHLVKEKLIRQFEKNILSKSKKIGIEINPTSVPKTGIIPEDKSINREHPLWNTVNAFWMAEHVEGEPIPKKAGSKEHFTVTKLKPHNWFGADSLPGLEILKRGKKYYIAIASWDEDNNLSEISNVISFTWSR